VSNVTFPQRRDSIGRIVPAMTRIFVGALLAISVFALAPSADARPASPDIHAVGFDQWCGNRVTVYEFRLANLGEQRRGLRGRIAHRRDGFAITETFTRSIAGDRRAVQGVRVREGERAVVTLRSQGRVVLRAKVFGHCSRETGQLPAPHGRGVR